MPNLESARTNLSLVLPAFNEAEIIEQAIEEATAALGEAIPAYEIIVVDDGSTDETPAIVQRISHTDPRVRLIQHESNQGYGAALRNGFAAATCELVAFTDADCQFDLSELDRFLLLSNNYDAVCGYRIDRQDTWLRCLYSQVYNQIVRLLLGIRVRDVDCALKLFRRETLQKTNIRTDGFLVNSDLLTQIRDIGGSIVEVGVTHRPRAAGQSTVSVRHIPTVLASLTTYWWNQVQFPGNRKTSIADADPGIHRRLGWMQLALVAIACLFLFTNLSYPLIDRDETRYAEIPREMLVSGDWVLPTLNFETYYDKPPMLYWLVASSYSLLGIHEWSARLVPTLAALGTLLLVLWFGNRHFDRRVAVISGGVLMLTAGFAFCSRYLLMDGVLTFFSTASLMTALEAVISRTRKTIHWGWWSATSILCGLGFLTKGPLSIVLLLPIVFAFSWLTRDAAKIRWIHVAGLLTIVAGIIMPWMIAVSFRDKTFLWEFFIHHNVQRFAGRYHDRPFWYFLPVLLAAGHPWSFLTIPVTRHLTTRSESVRSQRPPIVGFLCLWAAWMFIFFSASRCKLPTYLLPTAPAFALLLGMYVSRLIGPNSTLDGWERFAAFWSARLASLMTCLIGVGTVSYIHISGHSAGIVGFAWSMLWTALLCGTLFLFSERRNRHFAWLSTTSLAAVLLMMFMHELVPEYSRSHTIFAKPNHLAGSIIYNDAVKVATVDREFSEVPFYLRRDDIKNFTGSDSRKLADFVRDHRSTLLVVDQDILIGELRKRMPPGTRLQSIGSRGPARLIEATRPNVDYVTSSAAGGQIR